MHNHTSTYVCFRPREVTVLTEKKSQRLGVALDKRVPAVRLEVRTGLDPFLLEYVANLCLPISRHCGRRCLDSSASDGQQPWNRRYLFRQSQDPHLEDTGIERYSVKGESTNTQWVEICVTRLAVRSGAEAGGRSLRKTHAGTAISLRIENLPCVVTSCRRESPLGCSRIDQAFAPGGTK
jgi:hypothetical protein